ncbi:photosystem II lipoprotein Psb27 [Chloropicon primus]|uniref:Photosystem II lipoprotein Psb27 n=2 Tax=Chloropicon primus TaxID=1764295 RepID=A0A5B8MNG0_9CHLO|nr:photosystem II lipoprotein Psb27 [Chloropicon primus]UPR01239.1 photosystem II lipoprotein Psb27 [Chloropicon primus]|eukprot:QDZ22019.1 photosystem II lipoprotein Psb27 [Chloropicon primus]
MKHLVCNNKAVAAKPLAQGRAGNRASRVARNVCVRAHADKAAGVLRRRESVLAGLFSGLVAAKPAFAGFFGGIPEDVYVNDTTEVLGVLKSTLALTNESTDSDQVVNAVRQESNKWVAKYRRSDYIGRPSYGNTYSAINAVLGHYNNFGPDTLFPRRRLERVVKEVDDAGRALSRGR